MSLYMKTIKKYIIIVPLTLLGFGCSATSKLPSVTLGGAANTKAAVAASANKEGVNVTLPLVKVDVPLPSASVNK